MPPTDAPLVSAVITTYDRPAMLARAIESVVAQTYSPIELVVVDDHSPESPRDVVADADTDGLHDVTFVREPENRGVSSLRNTGIEHASGAFVAFLDDDDEWTPEKIERQLAVFDRRPEVGAVCAGRRSVDEHGETIHTRRVDYDGDVTKRFLLGDMPPLPSVVVRTSVLDGMDGFDESLRTFEDNEWFVRLSQHTDVASVADPLVVSHRGDGHEQLTDGIIEKAEVMHPRFADRCRPIAADYGSLFERKFRAHRSFQTGRTLLTHDESERAQSFLRTAVRLWPFEGRFFAYLTAAELGDDWYRRGQALKRRLV